MENRSFIQSFIARPEFGPLVLLVVELVVFWGINPDFLSPQNISNILAFTVELGLIALAMTLLMTSGEFDLSVGSLFGFSPVLMWTLFNGGVTSLEMGFLIALVVAAFIGLVNGWFVTRLKIPSFLVTLGMLLVVRGTALFVTDGFPQRTWSAEGSLLADILVGDFYIGPFRIYASLFWFIGAAIVLGYVLTQSRTGNWIQAAGGNPNAARARGVNVNRVKVGLFVLSAVMASLAGVISSLRTSAANPNSGTGYELEVIAMVVIGGTALTGGRGTIIGTVLGILILRVMRNGIVLIGVPGLAYNIFIGAIILGMMALHSWLERPAPGRDVTHGRTGSSAWTNIRKSYGRVQALVDANFHVNEREIVGLLGDNGAGKSTLIKVLSGAVPLTSGDIFVRGKKVDFRSTSDAIAEGIETIYQDSALVTQLSIARNLFLGREPIKPPRFLNRMDQEAMNVVARDLLKQVGISKNIPPTTPIGSLSGGERQAVAIARAMHFDSDLIILDEPTNNLGVAETQGVLSFVRSARDSGHSCIFIAHNIHHVFQVVDRIVVMRRGKVVADDIDPKKTTVAEVERIITGMSDKEIRDAISDGPRPHG